MDALGTHPEVCAVATRKVGKGRSREASPPATENVDDAEGEVWADKIDEIDVALADLPADAVVKVYRIPENGEKEWCWTGDPASVSEARIAKFGPGEYLVLARSQLANGGEGFRRRRKVRIAAGLTPEPNAALNGVIPAGTLADQIASAAVVGLLKSMQDSQDRSAAQAREHSAAMALLFKQITEPRVDPLMMEIVKSQLGAAHKTADPFDVAARIAEIGAKGHRGSALSELAGALDTLEKLKSRLGGGGGNGEGNGEGAGNNWADFFLKLLPRVLPETPAAAAGEVAAPNARAALPPGPDPVSPLPSHLTALEPFLPDIINAAERGVDPSSAADWIIANLPDEALGFAERVMSTDTLTADLMAAEPRLRAHREFLVGLKTAALAGIAEALAPDAGG